MNSFINREGKRKWARSEKVEDRLGRFSLLKGYTPEIDALIEESLREIGFESVERGLLHFRGDPLIYVMKKGRWMVCRGGGRGGAGTDTSCFMGRHSYGMG